MMKIEMPRPRRIRITTVVLLILLGLVAGRALLGGHARERVLAAGRIFLPSHHMHDRAGPRVRASGPAGVLTLPFERAAAPLSGTDGTDGLHLALNAGNGRNALEGAHPQWIVTQVP